MIDCPNEECEGHIEISTKIYMLPTDGRIVTGLPAMHPNDDGVRVEIDGMEFDDSVNDYIELNGQRIAFNMEGELFVGCSDCGEEFLPVWGDTIVKSVDGQAERVRRERGPYEVSMKIRVENTYADETITNEQDVTVPVPLFTSTNTEALDQWFEEHFFDFTGTGPHRANDNAVYEVTIIECSAIPWLVGKSYEWD